MYQAISISIVLALAASISVDASVAAMGVEEKLLVERSTKYLLQWLGDAYDDDRMADFDFEQPFIGEINRDSSRQHLFVAIPSLNGGCWYAELILRLNTVRYVGGGFCESVTAAEFGRLKRWFGESEIVYDDTSYSDDNAPPMECRLARHEETIVEKWTGLEDDKVAKEIRAAAEKEKDPDLRQKLWLAYDNYRREKHCGSLLPRISNPDE